ncbi:MAG: hypothetical protein WD359_06090 [Dehalococcoidia bacterium]
MKERGLFDPAVFEEAIYKTTMRRTHELDKLAQSLLNAICDREWLHSSFITGPRPSVWSMTKATKYLYRFAGDGIDCGWQQDGSRLDAAFNTTWEAMMDLCVPKNQSHGWTDGYEIAPDMYGRDWAREVANSK